MRVHFERAISNIIKHGDTDIFPYPVENLLFYDKKADSIDLLLAIDKQFEENLTRFAPMNHATAPSRRGFINEIAFQIFLNALSRQVDSPATQDNEARCISKARHLILGLERAEVADMPDPDEEEMDDAREQIRRLRLFFQEVSRGRVVETKPKFSGCGIIDSCEGDVYFEGELFEIKAGDRNVRSVDLRQLLVYSALNYAEQKRQIQRIGLFNPRVGTHFSSTLDEFCAEISGRPTIELLSEIIQVFSSGDISR